ncbi:DGQHR domain-containing protein [Nitrosopumilus sp.]|uniref:DGQHR domain-containing protein n=1 Tax=Nitrosopumilus sp. TaxID=2024843 RepID=UPI003D1048DA
MLFREFLVFDDDAGTKPVSAIPFKQNSVRLHLFTLPASQLLKIAYVSRRGTSRDESYQRIINPNRLKSLTNFILDSKNLLMANPIIIAFDPETYGSVTYNEEKKLNFKNIACSAWVIDGQHRIFAFKDIDLPSKKFKKYDIQIPIVALEKTNTLLQSETFLNINYYQKKIDSLLIYDLAASFQYPRNALVWPSLLTLKLNESGILQGLIKVKELDEKKSLQTTNFVRTILEELLGYNSAIDDYDGPLYTLAKFNKNTRIDTPKNESAFKSHLDILQKYFVEVMALTKKQGTNWKDNATARGFLSSSAIQAFMLVLSAILRVEKKKNIDFKSILKPLENVDFTAGTYAEYRAGYPSIQGYTKDLLQTISDQIGKDYRYTPISQIRKKIETAKKSKAKSTKSKAKSTKSKAKSTKSKAKSTKSKAKSAKSKTK